MDQREREILDLRLMKYMLRDELAQTVWRRLRCLEGYVRRTPPAALGPSWMRFLRDLER